MVNIATYKAIRAGVLRLSRRHPGSAESSDGFQLADSFLKKAIDIMY
jgi:hypothetical protein